MINVTNISLRFSDKKLFEEVNMKFTPGNCYGVIGANGAGKSTFLKILSGEVEPNSGQISMTPGERMAVLKQDHYQFDEDVVLDIVMMGHERLYQIMKEKDEIYAKEEFTEEDGVRAAELEAEFAELDGWEAEVNGEKLLMGLGVAKDQHTEQLKNLEGSHKVKVLLAQALFGNPDVLLLDEPTNHLDFKAITWLENFLMDYEKTVIVVSHDRHFLNTVCTHMVDIDFNKAQMFVGNYDFWYESSQLALRMMKDQNKKKEEKVKELQSFIARFSSNASKAKQATSRKKMLDKINIDDIKPSTRRYPFVGFNPEREAGKEILSVENISKTINGEKVLNNISFTLRKGDKVILLGESAQAKTTLMEILMGKTEADTGSYQWGTTTSQSYLPSDNSEFFEGLDLSLVDWLRQYSEEKDETYIRGFLGKMLFSGEEAMKKTDVLSGGERVRCMLSRMMLSGANVLLLDEPTNHLDLESIQAVNNGLDTFKGTLLFSSHDYKFIETVANRIIEITPNGIVDRIMSFDEYINDDKIQKEVSELYKAS